MRLELIAYRLTADCSTIELYRQNNTQYIKERCKKKTSDFYVRGSCYLVANFNLTK